MPAPDKPAKPTLSGPEDQSRKADSLRIAWTAATGAIKYEVSCGGNTQSFSGGAIPFVATFTGLASNTAFPCKVKAIASDGASRESDTETFFTRPVSPASISLTDPEDGRRDTSVMLTWTPVAGVPRYRVVCSTGATMDFDPPTAAGRDFTGLPPNTACQFSVFSFDPGKGGLALDGSAPLPTATRPPAPPAPRRLSVVPVQSLLVEWAKAPAFPGDGDGGVAIELGLLESGGGVTAWSQSPGNADGTFTGSIAPAREVHVVVRVVTTVLAPSNPSAWGPPSDAVSLSDLLAIGGSNLEKPPLGLGSEVRRGMIESYYGTGRGRS